MCREALIVRWLCAWIVCAFLASEAGAAESYTNPIISDGADPWVVQKDGFYYYTQTSGFDVKVRKASQITGPNGLGNATAVNVFTPPSPNNQGVWAPELHFLNGKWYIYYAADDGNNANHRMYVAEANTSNPQGAYTLKGKIYDTANDRWAIDGTVLQKEDGSMFFVWSGWPSTSDGRQNIYIAPMSNPWTISGPRVLIGTNYYSWEYGPPSWGSWLQEGPQVLKRNGKTFIVYSASGSWTDDYCLGMLVNTSGNFTNAAAWTKTSTPVFQSYSDPNGGIFGPGHCSFTKSVDEAEDLILYHAAKFSGAGWNRNVRVQRFSWNANDTPNFGTPIPTPISLTVPSGEGTPRTSTTLYTLTVNSGSGGVRKSPEQLSYKPGTLVTLTAYDNQAYRFTHWSGDAWTTNHSVTVKMDRNKTVTANYPLLLVVMDNPDAVLSNTWVLSNISTQRFGSNYHYAPTSNTKTHTATYRPLIPTTGKYDLFLIYSGGVNRSTRSPWLISSADGTNTVLINQEINGGTLQSLGSARFTQGTNGYVELSNDTGEAGRVVIADGLLINYSARQDAFPTIYAQPLSKTVPPGTVAGLSVGALGNPAYQWQFQNQDLIGATGSSLSIPNFSAQNEGEYRVVLSNAFGMVTSSNALLMANSPLRISTYELQVPGGSGFQIAGIIGSNYVLEASENLSSWFPLQTNLSINGIWNASDSVGTNFSKRFYRVVMR